MTLSEPTSSTIFLEDRTYSESPWIIAGYVVGGIVVFLLLAVCLLAILFIKRRAGVRKEVDDQTILNMALLESGNAGDNIETKNLNSPTDTPPPPVSTDSSTPPCSDEGEIEGLIAANVDETLAKATPCTPPPPRNTPLRRSHPPPISTLSPRSHPGPQSTSTHPRIPSPPRSSSPPRNSSPPRSPPPPYSPPPPRSPSGPRSPPRPRSPPPPRSHSFLKVQHRLEVCISNQS